MRKLSVSTTLAAIVVFGGSTWADTIKFADGRKEQDNVTVTDETLEKVEYRLPSIRQPQSYPADKVLEVEYSDTSDEYQLAVENYQGGYYADAAPLFLAAAADARKKEGLKAQCVFKAGESYQRAGNFAEAVRTFDQLMAEMAQSRYVPHAQLGRALSLLRGGDANRARQGFQKLKSSGYGGRWEKEADLHLMILDEGKNSSQALDGYQRLITETEKDYPMVANQAKLRIGRVYIASKQYDKAKQYFQTILDNRAGSSREVIAGAYNGLGTAIRNQGTVSKADWKTSLFAHLRVRVSYSDVDAEQAEALYGAGKAFQNVEGVEDAAQRARQLLGSCISLYPDSDWAEKARGG